MKQFTQTKNRLFNLIWLLTAGFLTLFTFTSSVQAHAGGQPQIVNGQAGPFLVSVWSLPNPLVSGDVNFIAAVAQEKEINGYTEAVAILDAEIEFVLTSSDGETIRVTASQENAVNKLFYEAYFELPEAGEWDVTVNVTHDGQSGSAQFVASAARPPLNINWTLVGGIAVLLIAIGWFIWQSRQTDEALPAAEKNKKPKATA